MKKSTLLIILGNLTAFGPFVTDFYLPCLPELTSYFSASASIIQMSLTAGMLGLAIGQLFIGPITDKFGRRTPLLWCLLFFILSTVGCVLSSDIRLFLFFRLFQGLTGASGLVISKAIIADTFTARDLAKYLAILAAVQGAAPIVAPVIGGAAFSLTSWQGAFGVLCAWGIWLLYACRKLKESLCEENRLQIPVWKSFRCYFSIVGNGEYMVMNLLQGFSSAALMAYISASPFIFQNHFQLTAMQYSVCFACNALGLVIGSSVVTKMKNLQKTTVLSVMGLLATSLFASSALLRGWPFPIFEAILFLMLFSIGMLTPVAITRALNSVNENKGMASALLGAMPFLLGGIVAPLSGIGNMVRSMSLLIVSCSVICTILYLISVKWNDKDENAFN